MNSPDSRSFDLRRGGFTLIELVVLLMVVAVATGIAAPRMSNWVAITQVDGVASDLVADIAFARSLAVRSGRRAGVRIQSTGYEVLATRPDGNVAVVKQVNASNASHGLVLSLGSGTLPSTVWFDSRGMTRQPSTVRVVIKRGDIVRGIDLLSTGRVLRAN